MTAKEEAFKNDVFNELSKQAIRASIVTHITQALVRKIALSILSEIKAVLSGKQGLSLNSNKGTIHSRIESVIEQVKVSEKN